MKDSIVFYHGKCPDGFGAAFAAWLVLGETADYVPCSYGDAPGDVTGKHVYIVDFSFEHEVMQVLDAQAKSLVLLDHHKTSRDKLHGFQCRCGKIHFDLTRSGARLAWEHFHPNTPVPPMIAHIQDRDLWTWALPQSADFLAALDVEPMEFQAFKKVLEFSEADYAQYVREGSAMNRKFQSLCASMAADAIPVTLLGHAGLMTTGTPEFVSEVGSRLAKASGTFGLIWRLLTVDTIKVSLRSVDTFEVEPLARAFGGGGHPQAASFVIPLSQLADLVQGRLTPSA